MPFGASLRATPGARREEPLDTWAGRESHDTLDDSLIGTGAPARLSA